MEPSNELLAKWAYGTIAAAVDVGFSVDRLINVMRPENIRKLAEIASAYSPEEKYAAVRAAAEIGKQKGKQE